MSSYIAKVYADLIRKTDKTGKTIDDVPEQIRAEVQTLLDADAEYITHEDGYAPYRLR